MTTKGPFTGYSKGDEISIIGGDYKGLDGWLWNEKRDTPKFQYVIVATSAGEIGTRVKKSSVVQRRRRPANRVEAALKMHSDIEAMLTKVCKKLARCDLTGDEPELQTLFHQKMVDAHNQQMAEGKDALFFAVASYDDEDDNNL